MMHHNRTSDRQQIIKDLLDSWNLNHPFEVWGEDSVLDKPTRELVPLIGVGAIDRQTRLSILILSILQVTGYFLIYAKVTC